MSLIDSPSRLGSGRNIVRGYRSLARLGLGLLMLALCTARSTAAPAWLATVPPLSPGMARVWILRMQAQVGSVTGADPMVFVNGAALAQSAMSTVYYHDFQPGTYRFTVQSFGVPANLVDTVNLAPGTQTYLQVQAAPNWEMGSTAGGGGFAVMTMSPEVALPSFVEMRYLGER